VAPSVPAKTIAELVAYAKAHPGQLVFGYGLGTTPHILGESFRRAAGIEFTNIPYRGGEQARADLLGGRVHLNIAPLPNMMPLIEAGQVRPLAFTGPKRSPHLPAVPTMIESGLPQVGYDPDVWLGFFAPIGTPAEAIERLNRVVNEILASPEMKPVYAKFGFEPQITTPKEFADFVAREVKKWPPLLQQAGLKSE